MRAVVQREFENHFLNVQGQIRNFFDGIRKVCDKQEGELLQEVMNHSNKMNQEFTSAFSSSLLPPSPRPKRAKVAGEGKKEKLKSKRKKQEETEETEEIGKTSEYEVWDVRHPLWSRISWMEFNAPPLGTHLVLQPPKLRYCSFSRLRDLDFEDAFLSVHLSPQGEVSLVWNSLWNFSALSDDEPRPKIVCALGGYMKGEEKCKGEGEEKGEDEGGKTSGREFEKFEKFEGPEDFDKFQPKLQPIAMTAAGTYMLGFQRSFTLKQLAHASAFPPCPFVEFQARLVDQVASAICRRWRVAFPFAGLSAKVIKGKNREDAWFLSAGCLLNRKWMRNVGDVIDVKTKVEKSVVFPWKGERESKRTCAWVSGRQSIVTVINSSSTTLGMQEVPGSDSWQKSVWPRSPFNIDGSPSASASEMHGLATGSRLFSVTLPDSVWGKGEKEGEREGERERVEEEAFGCSSFCYVKDGGKRLCRVHVGKGTVSVLHLPQKEGILESWAMDLKNEQIYFVCELESKNRLGVAPADLSRWKFLDTDFWGEELKMLPDGLYALRRWRPKESRIWRIWRTVFPSVVPSKNNRNRDKQDSLSAALDFQGWKVLSSQEALVLTSGQVVVIS